MKTYICIFFGICFVNQKKSSSKKPKNKGIVTQNSQQLQKCFVDKYWLKIKKKIIKNKKLTY